MGGMIIKGRGQSDGMGSSVWCGLGFLCMFCKASLRIYTVRVRCTRYKH